MDFIRSLIPPEYSNMELFVKFILIIFLLVFLFELTRKLISLKHLHEAKGKSLGYMRFNRNCISFIEYFIGETRYVAPLVTSQFRAFNKDRELVILIDKDNPPNRPIPEEGETINFYDLGPHSHVFEKGNYNFVVPYIALIIAIILGLIFYGELV